MLISPIKSAVKNPVVVSMQYGRLSDRQNTVGNSLSLRETTGRELDVEILGATLATPADPEQEVSPDNPQTLTSLTSFDLMASGKNLYRCIMPTNPYTVAGVTITGNSDGTITLNGTQSGVTDVYIIGTKSGGGYSDKMFAVFRAGEKAALSIERVSGSVSANSSNLSLKFAKVANDTSVFTGVMNLTAGSYTNVFTVVNYANLGVIRMTIPSAGIVFTNYVIRVQLEKSPVVSTYERPIPSVTDLGIYVPLRDTSNNQLEARGIGTYDVSGNFVPTAQDVIFKDTDEVWKLRSDTKHLFLKDLTWTEWSGNLNIYTATINDAKMEYNSSICSHFKNVAIPAANLETGQYRESTGTTDKRIFFRSDKETLVEFTAWLTAENPDLVYQTISSTLTVLSPTDQTALNASEVSFDGTTNISLSVEIGEIKADQWSAAALR